MQFLKQTRKSIDTLQEQLIELPLAIGDHEWNMYMTKELHYKEHRNKI